jgi:hypothetical protein
MQSLSPYYNSSLLVLESLGFISNTRIFTNVYCHALLFHGVLGIAIPIAKS